jgi:hypothetical protein
MDIKDLPKIKDTKEKSKKTFFLSIEAAKVYTEGKNKGVDTTKICTDALEKALLDIKHLIITK